MDWWSTNAFLVEKVYGGFVNWEENFYTCPECGEPVYKDDWRSYDFENFLCPVCEWTDRD